MNFIETLPNYAKDIKLNLSSILMRNNTVLNDQQFYGTLVATAMMCKNKMLIKSIVELASEKISADEISAAKAASALMAMNNIYYRFTHLASNQDYAKMPANLRMSLIANPGIPKNDFELFSIAVSAINGCGKCIDAHEKVLLSHQVTKEMIQEVVRIAAIIHSVAMILETENCCSNCSCGCGNT